MDVAAQAGLNAHFTDEAGAAHCEGDETETSQPEKEPQPGNGKTREGATLTARYETTFQSESLLAFKFMHFDYAGGAHGDGALYGAIIDVDKGRLLGPAELFSPEHLKAANRFIYEALSARPEGEIFRDQIEAKKDSFLHDRVCEGCSLVLLPGGLHVVFQTYEVASFAEGNIDIALPANLVDYPSVRAALADVP